MCDRKGVKVRLGGVDVPADSEAREHWHCPVCGLTYTETMLNQWAINEAREPSKLAAVPAGGL